MEQFLEEEDNITQEKLHEALMILKTEKPLALIKSLMKLLSIQKGKQKRYGKLHTNKLLTKTITNTV